MSEGLLEFLRICWGVTAGSLAVTFYNILGITFGWKPPSARMFVVIIGGSWVIGYSIMRYITT